MDDRDLRRLVGGGQGVIATASFTPTATPYAANDIMDVAKQLAFADPVDGVAAPANCLVRILTSVLRIDVAALQASEAAYALQLHSATPPSALADNAAWSLSSADLAGYRGSVALGTPVDLGNALYIRTGALDHDVRLGVGGSLWAQLQTLAGFTPTIAVRQVTLYGVVL
jgi:hypothetical protein